MGGTWLRAAPDVYTGSAERRGSGEGDAALAAGSHPPSEADVAFEAKSSRMVRSTA